MGKLIYSLNVSLDGFVETSDHSLDWATVDEELHQWFNDQTRGLSASLYGRRMYELMAAYWPMAQSDPAATGVEREFSKIWLAMPKIVFSSSLETVDWNSRLVQTDAVDEAARLTADTEGDMDVGGATLAASLIRAGLVDEFRLLVHPVAIGSGTPFFPPGIDRTGLRLIESRSFQSGVVYLGYRNT